LDYYHRAIFICFYTIAPMGLGDFGNAQECRLRLNTIFMDDRDDSITLFPDFYRFQFSGGADCFTCAAAIAFCRINTGKGLIIFFIPYDLYRLIRAGLQTGLALADAP